jgi:NADH:ubiquinone oxidoreductase subunit 2 (subunit N)
MEDLNKRYQRLLVLWFALLMSIVMYFIFSLVAGPQIGHADRSPRNSLLIVGLTALGTFLVILSFPVKRKFLDRSVENQDVGLVQKGLVFACAICEVSALLGLIERFIMGNREYYVLFVIAAAGTAAHFPRRSQLEAASHKLTNVWNK